MKISLNPEMEKYIEEKVSTGQYASVEDAVNALLLHVRRQEELTPQEIEELRAQIDVGIAEADRGEFTQFNAEQVIAQGRADLAVRKKVS